MLAMAGGQKGGLQVGIEQKVTVSKLITYLRFAAFLLLFRLFPLDE